MFSTDRAVSPSPPSVPTPAASREGSPAILRALQEASSRDLIALLFRFDMAEAFLRQLKEREVVFASVDLSDPDKVHQQALQRYCEENAIKTEEDRQSWCLSHGMSTEDLASEAIHAWRRRELREQLVTTSGESLYLRYKDKLDRVLYSLLRVEDPGLCQELYYAIEAAEISFGEAARCHSRGPEAKTQGIVGPVDLTTPHPEIAARLRTAQAGLLIGPFQADDWFSVIRLEYRFDSEYDESTRAFLEEVCFKSQISADLQADLQALIGWLSSGTH
jgi:parvulin-like peptidyl-prolyl isomerase